MTNKITEEQYQKIIEIENNSIAERVTNNIIDFLTDELILNTGDGGEKVNIALAIANPLTREWAHDNFVEKEKKYVWNSKKKDDAGYAKRLFKSKGGMISDYSVIVTKNFENTESDEELTESEIKSWGYNTDMFDKEEV